jgi:hypothetical protein
MIGNILVNLTLAAILYGLFLWTPWASLIAAGLSSFFFVVAVFFDREHTEEITRQLSDRLSVIMGMVISIAGVAISIYVLFG